MKKTLSRRLLSLVVSGMLVVTGIPTPQVYAAEEYVTQETTNDGITLEGENQTETPSETVRSEAEESEVRSEEQITETSKDADEETSQTDETTVNTETVNTETVDTEDINTEATENTVETEEAEETTSQQETETLTEDETAEQTTEEQQTLERPEEASILVINPLYEEIIDLDELTMKFESEQNVHLFSNDTTRASSFQNLEDAAAYLRDQMVARETTIAVQIPMTVVNANGGLQNAPSVVFNKALEHTEACSGQAGDALAAGYLKYQASMASSSGTATFTYTVFYFTTAEEEQQLTEKVAEIMGKLALSGKSDYQKAKAIHDYICDNVTYDDTYSKYSAYDALCTGSAVCQGYAISFYRLCKEAGLPVRIITGKGNGGAHAWNIVKISDNARAAGKYYNVDCTWDSQKSGTLHLYFLVSEAEFGDHVRSEEYNTAEFHAQYPMSDSSYIDSGSFEPGLNKENPEVSFTTLHDETVSSAAAGKPKLLIFFRTTCGNSQRTIKAISEYKFPNVDIYAAEIDGASKDAVASFKNTYGSDTLTFLYDTSGNNNMNLFRYAQAAGITEGNSLNVALPVIFYIDGSNNLQHATQGVQNAAQIEAKLNYYCGGPVVGQYTVTYVLDGGTNHPDNPVKFKETSGIIKLEDPTKDGYTFAGWYLDAAFKLKISQLDSSVASNITLYAKWNPIAADGLNCDNFYYDFIALNGDEVLSEAQGKPKLIIFFSRNCGMSRQTIKDIATNGLPNVDIIAAETTGASLAEVQAFKDTYGSDAITFAFDQYQVTHTRYANDYVDRSGINNFSTIIICYIDANNKYQHITFGQSSANAIKTNIDRYCSAAEGPSPSETYTITYELNGGTNHADNPKTYTFATETITLKAPSKAGDSFIGWYLDAALTYPIKQIEKGSHGNLTLYAKWKSNMPEGPDPAETYTITYELNGGTNHADNPAAYTADTAAIVLKAPAKDGYTFGGWYRDADFTQSITQIAAGTTGNLTLYAKWTKTQTPENPDDPNKPENPGTPSEPETPSDAEYTVTFNMQGHGSAPQSYTGIKSGALIQKPSDPTASGYRFEGWYKDSSCKTAWNFSTDKVTADTTLYAKWVKTDVPADEDISKYPVDQRKDLKPIAKIADIKAKVYDGTPYRPVVKVTITDNGRQVTLTEGTDYRVLYSNNTEPGTGKVTVRGNGIYKGEITKPFQINKKPLKDLNIITGGMSVDAKTEPPVYVYDGAVELVNGTDYTVSKLTDVKGTSAKATVTAAKNNKYYEGTVTVKLTLYKADADKIINPENVTLSAKSVPFTGKAVTTVVPTVKLGSATLEKNKHYKVQYKDNTKAGTALVIITGKGQYKGKVVKSFTIEPAKSKLTVNKISDKTYNGKLQKPKVTVKDGSKTLKLNRDYIVTYSKNLSAGKATVTITGIGNYAGCTTSGTFTIKPQKISKASVKGSVSKGITLTYSKQPLVEGVDYKLTYGAEKKGKIQVTITGLNKDFTGTITKSLKK